MKRIFTLILFAAFISMEANAQDGIGELFKSGPADATKLIQAYAEPFFKGFGTGINGGWTNTAKTKKLFRLEVRVSASAVFVPSADKTFDITQIGLSNQIRPSTSNHIAPTFGGNVTAPSIDVYSTGGSKIATFQLPSGTSSIIPAPQIQATLGLVFNTDVTLRYLPTINIGDKYGKVDMIGFGVKHDIMQDFGVVGKLVPFDLALAFGYTKLSYTFPLTVNPDQGSTPKDASQSTDFSNQRVEGHFSGVNVSAIISKKLLFFTPFASVGYSSASTDIGMLGNYPFTNGTNGVTATYTTYNNPISINETSISGLRADIGFQLDFIVLKLYASYSAAQYSSINGGIALGL